MAKRQRPAVKSFSLTLSAPGFKAVIEIPKMKKGTTSVGGDQTYLMAIDKFTTQFQSKEEMLDYLIQNNLVTIPSSISYNQICIKIEHTNKEHDYGSLPVAYNENQELVDFLNNNQIASSFELSNPTIEDFKQTIINRWSKGMYQAEYRMYMEEYKNIRNPFGRDLKYTLIKLDKQRKFNEFQNGNLAISSLNQYHNIRAHLITKNTLDKKLHDIYEKYVISFNERAEYTRDKTTEQSKTISRLEIIKTPEEKPKIEKEKPMQMALFTESLFFDDQESEIYKTR